MKQTIFIAKSAIKLPDVFTETIDHPFVLSMNYVALYS